MLTALVLSIFLINVSNTYSYDTRDILPDKGYWNYLPKQGLGGRLLHYLVADSNAFGNDVTNLDVYFNEKYTPEKYQELERQVVLSLPSKDELKLHLMKLIPKLMPVRDPKTGKTLGDALMIIFKLASNPDVEKEIVERLDLKNPEIIALEAPSRSNYDLKTTLKNTILYNPSMIINVLQDPQVVHFITSSVLQYLSSDEVNEGIQQLQGMIGMLEISYSSVLRNGNMPIFALKDKRSGLSLGDTLKALANIIEGPEFATALLKLLNENLADDLHKKTQEIFSQAGDEEKQKSKISAEDLANMLSLIGVDLSMNTVTDIIELSKKGQLAAKVTHFLDEVDDIENLDADKMTQFLHSKGANLGTESIEQVLDLAAKTSPVNASLMLRELGLNISQRQAETIIKLIKNIKLKYDSNSNRPNPWDSPSKNSQVDVTQEEESDEEFVIVSADDTQQVDEATTADQATSIEEASEKYEDLPINEATLEAPIEEAIMDIQRDETSRTDDAVSSDSK